MDKAGILTIDRFIGKIKPIFRLNRLEFDYHYNPPGIRGEPRYLEGVVRLTKLHGSLDWRFDTQSRNIYKEFIPFGHGEIKIDDPYEQVVIYPNAYKGIDTAFFPYSELFRDFSIAICRPNSVLVTYGYGFGDSHINKIISNMLTIPSTHLVIISFDKDYGNILADFVHEIYQFNNWTLSDTYPDLFFFIGDAGVANANWGIYNGQLWGNNYRGKFYIYVNDNAINLLNIGWENMSKIGDLYFYNDTLYTKTVSDLLNDKLIFGCYDMGVFIGSTKGCHYFDTFLVDNTGYSDVDTTTGTTGMPQAAQIVYGSLWGDYDKYNYEGYNIKFNEYLSLLSTSYNTIRTDMINNAQSYWTYLKNLGYNNASEVPEDLIPVYPDVLLDNIEALGNLTGNETFAMYYAIMQQLTEQLNDMIANNQTGNITWDDIMLGNFTGKQANIILQEATATTGTGTVLVNGWAYIIPYEQDLTLTVNTTYAITTNATLPSWANAKISQKISIYDIANHKWYYITPTDTTYYNLTVKGLMVGNQTTDSVKYDILDANDLAYTTWGFRFVEIQNPEDFIIPIPQDESGILEWLEEHKGLIVIACIVLGVILTGSSRKGTGGYTLGLLLLVAGIGMAIYFYILPAWNSVNSFFDKITFWD